MIPIQPQPEPAEFDQKVRKPGLAFLEGTPRPTQKDWSSHDYWGRIKADLMTAYREVCAYSAIRVRSIEASDIDHFQPKSLHPKLAYEWSNFRFARKRTNSKKGVKTILDPFHIEPDWFVLDFTTFMVYPNQNLPDDLKQQIQETIGNLGLNERDYVDVREEIFNDFSGNPVRLQKESPFIAYEMVRQGLSN
ncbi:MAG: hypothetical protein K1Y36_27535 [Blastocatellia bacterium]|nr:hypothetical protein [Blastocatellia bacterium]